MTITKKSYERALLIAFQTGMVDGYGVEHTDLQNEEKRACEDYIKRMGFKYSYGDLTNSQENK